MAQAVTDKAGDGQQQPRLQVCPQGQPPPPCFYQRAQISRLVDSFRSFLNPLLHFISCNSMAPSKLIPAAPTPSRKAVACLRTQPFQVFFYLASTCRQHLSCKKAILKAACCPPCGLNVATRPACIVALCQLGRVAILFPDGGIRQNSSLWLRLGYSDHVISQLIVTHPHGACAV